MDVRGVWKVKEVHVPTPDGEKVFTPDNPPEDERFEDAVEMMQYLTEFADGGDDAAYAYDAGTGLNPDVEK